MGVACPAVSQMTIARAPQLIAVEYRLLDGFGIAARGVFGDVHRLEPERDRILDGFLGGGQQEVVRPAFGVAADRAGADEGCSLDGQAGSLHDFGDGPDVVLVGARRAVGVIFIL